MFWNAYTTVILWILGALASLVAIQYWLDNDMEGEITLTMLFFLVCLSHIYDFIDPEEDDVLGA